MSHPKGGSWAPGITLTRFIDDLHSVLLQAPSGDVTTLPHLPLSLFMLPNTG